MHDTPQERVTHRRRFLGVLLSVGVGAGCLDSGTDTTPPAEDGIDDESIIRYRGEYDTYAVQSGPSSGSEDECDGDVLNVEKAEEFS